MMLYSQGPLVHVTKVSKNSGPPGHIEVLPLYVVASTDWQHDTVATDTDR